MSWFTKQPESSPGVSVDKLIQTFERALADKDEVIEFLRVELQASREREGWYQQKFTEERERSNAAADVLIVENGRRPLTHIADQVMGKRGDAVRAVHDAEADEDPFETYPLGDARGTFKTWEEASEGYAGEVDG